MFSFFFVFLDICVLSLTKDFDLLQNWFSHHIVNIIVMYGQTRSFTFTDSRAYVCSV